MFNRMTLKNILLVASTLFLISTETIAQEVDITDALKNIENGKVAEATSILEQLKQTNPNDPAIIFLDAVLTKDGNDAIKKYSYVFENFPKNQYADVSLFRVFSFYYAIGSYKKAESYLNRLKQNYPQSPYIAAANKKIPDIEEELNTPKTGIEKPVALKIKIVKAEESKPAAANFTIQAGAFLNTDNANRLSDQLSKDGFPTEITAREIGGGQLKVVNAGKFASEEEAKKALASIEAKYNLRGRVIPITNK